MARKIPRVQKRLAWPMPVFIPAKVMRVFARASKTHRWRALRVGWGRVQAAGLSPDPSLHRTPRVSFESSKHTHHSWLENARPVWQLYYPDSTLAKSTLVAASDWSANHIERDYKTNAPSRLDRNSIVPGVSRSHRRQVRYSGTRQSPVRRQRLHAESPRGIKSTRVFL
jgi:hypothetical protein